MDVVDLLTIGEVGDINIEIQEAITSMLIELSADSVSQIKFSVHDPDFVMLANNYFAIGRRVVFNGIEFEIAAVAARYDSISSCEVTARSKGVQFLRRDLGRVTLGNVSPTQAAAEAARLAGLGFFGEASPANGNIVRQENEDGAESTWSVLSRLAGDLNFRLFEAKGVLFFASEEFIVAEQPQILVSLPPESDVDEFYAVNANIRKSVDSKTPTTIQLNLLKNESSINLFPGVALFIDGYGFFDQEYDYPFMVDRVSFDAGPTNLVSVSGTSMVDIEEINCTSQIFSKGSSGSCVKRIQQAVGAKVDGQFGPQTERLVKQYQNAKVFEGSLTLLPGELGVVGPTTWELIVNE